MNKEKISEDEKKRINKEIKDIKKELDKMTGDEKVYAQPAQIKTVSKLRIYYPTEVDDILYGVNVGNGIMDDIEKKIMELYFSRREK